MELIFTFGGICRTLEIEIAHVLCLGRLLHLDLRGPCDRGTPLASCPHAGAIGGGAAPPSPGARLLTEEFCMNLVLMKDFLLLLVSVGEVLRSCLQIWIH